MSDGTVHSHIGPSSANRWMNCGASVALITRLGLWGASQEEAEKGTVAHWVSSECLLHDQESWEFAGQEKKSGDFTFTVDEEMVVACQLYIDLVRNTVAAYKLKYPNSAVILHVERKVKSECDEEAFGTSDVVIEVVGVLIHVIDFKHGRVRVEPNDEQLKLYGEYSYECRSPKMLDAGEPNRIVLTICQPNMQPMHPQGPVRHFETTPEELADWLQEEVVPAIANTRDPEANFVIGDWCKYCPALAHCKAYQDSVNTIPVELVDRIAQLSNEDITKFRQMRKGVEKFFEAVNKEAFDRVVNRGMTILGCKPVHKLGNRQWRTLMLMDKDGKEVEVQLVTFLEEKFGKKAYEPQKVKSPAQIERMTGGKAITAQWAYAPSTGMTLADEDDVREPAVGLMNLAEQQDAKAAEAANAPLDI